jgi:hypothetical protein
MYLFITKCWFLAWFVGDRLLQSNFVPYGIIFMNVSVVITVAMVNAVKGFGLCGIIFMTVLSALDFAVLTRSMQKFHFLHVMYKNCQSSLELMCELSNPGSSEIAFEY